MRIAAAMLTAFLASGCSGDDDLTCADSGEAKGSVVTFATFARADVGGESEAEGIDIDGLDSTNLDLDGCYVNDFTSPDGRPGIDNQLGLLLPVIEDLVGTENIDAIIEGGIANGQLLIVFNVEGVDDPVNDDCVEVSFGAGAGTPFLDAEGNYVAYQTFGYNSDRARISRLSGRIVDGVLEAGPGHVTLPVQLLDADFLIELHGARFRMEIERDEIGDGFALDGFGGGGLEIADVVDIVENLNIGGEVVNGILPVLKNLADLAANESKTCSQVSAALRISTTPAFVDGSLELPPAEMDSAATD